MWYIIIFFVLLIGDQLTKAAIAAFNNAIPFNNSITVIDGFLSFDYDHNAGMAFGLLKNDWAQILFITLTVVALCFAVVYLIFLKNNSKWYKTSLMLIIVGGLGNLIDRIAFAYVRDFIHLHFFPFIFNIADSAITIGAIMFLIYFVFLSEDPLIKVKKREKT